MKKIQYSFFLAIAFMITAVSCQKAYDRPDIVIGTPGSGSGNGTLLSKLTIKGTGVDLVYTYGYNSNSQLTDFNYTAAFSGSTIFYKWHFFRDNAGKILQYSVKNNISGFPDSTLYTLHYTSGSSNFDYITGQYTFSGLPTKDSIIFLLANGKVSKYIGYGAYGANASYEATASTAYGYDVAGNIIKTTDSENDGTGTMVVTGIFDYEFDSKISPLQLGQEAYILEAARYFSKNNPIKAVSTDYTTSTAGVKSTNLYTFQYNSSNKPATAYAVDPANTSDTVHLVYSYQ
jgi:hypothetical protein